MQKYISFLRGINVGGKNKLPMVDLKKQMADFGFENIKTYIQSGNVIFETLKTSEKTLAEKIANSILKQYGFSPKVMVITFEKLQKITKNCPFNIKIENGNLLHFFFLSQVPKNADIDKMNEIKLESEAYEIIDDVFYFYTPDGFGRSKLAVKAEKLLDVDATARNFRTISKMLEIAG